MKRRRPKEEDRGREEKNAFCAKGKEERERKRTRIPPFLPF